MTVATQRCEKVPDMEKSIVGPLINFRGLVYSPINEQGVVFLFGRILEDLNLYIEEIRIKYPDCVARRYTGKGWERVYIEFEYLASNFLLHGHDPKECNIIVCWQNDLSASDKKKLPGVEIIELRSLIEELESTPIEEPDRVIQRSEYDLDHHFTRKNVNKSVQQLYRRLDEDVQQIDDNIFNKFAKTAITYYSPERNFVYLKFQKSQMVLNVYLGQATVKGVRAIKNHENWGKIRVKTEVSRRRFNEGTFHGYDFDPTMLRIGSMNMLLHGVENPDIRYRDSLAQGVGVDGVDTVDAVDAEKYTLILANPPFAESLDYESTAKDLLQVVKTKKTEGGRKRTEKSFLVPKDEIASNDFDLSINRYKEVVCEPVHYDPPKTILKQLAKPPLSLQRRFAGIVESVERQKARLRGHLEELDTLFASLQDRAFRGEL